MTSVTYLRHVFSANEMIRDPNKILAVQQWPTPTNVTTVWQFLGLASYYHHFSHIASPLQILIQKNTVFCWNESYQQAFTTLKEKGWYNHLFYSIPNFIHLQASLQYYYTDGSDVLYCMLLIMTAVS